MMSLSFLVRWMMMWSSHQYDNTTPRNVRRCHNLTFRRTALSY
jgi:hypothetical protein